MCVKFIPEGYGRHRVWSSSWESHKMDQASYTANTTVALLLAKHGQGRHIWDLSHHDIVQGLKVIGIL